MRHYRFLTKQDVAALYWSHLSDENQIFGRLQSFHSGLPEKNAFEREKALQQQLTESHKFFAVSPMFQQLTIRVKRGETNKKKKKKRVGCRFAAGFKHHLVFPSSLFVSFFHSLAGFKHPLVLPFSRVVEGDIVLFQAGDSVWCDVRVLHVDEEDPLIVLPPYCLRHDATVCRELISDVEPQGTEFTDARNMLWGGSTVLRGSGSGVVVHTFGKMLVDMYTSDLFVQPHPIWPQFGDLGRLTFGKKKLLSQFWARQFGVALRDCKATVKTVRGLSDADKSEQLCHVVIHWRSPLLRPAKALDHDDVCQVDHVRVGKFLREEPDELMGEVMTACAMCAAGWLSLDKMKTWSSGAIPISDVSAEGPTDPVGVALLRFALSHLGAKEFWRIRQSGFQVYSTRHGLLAHQNDANFFWSRSWEEARGICSHFMNNGKVKPANGAYWARVSNAIEELNGKRMTAVVVGKRTGKDPKKTFSDGIVLGLVVFAQKPAKEQEVIEAVLLLQQNLKFRLHLRCDSHSEVNEGC